MRVANEVGGVARLLDAKSEGAARWSAGYGAVPLLDAPLSLVLPFGVISDAVNRSGRAHADDEIVLKRGDEYQ